MKRLTMLLAAAGLSLGLAACDVEQTENAELPEVDVKGGNMPEFNVDAADVDVTTEKKTIEVPVVNVEEPDASQPEASN